MDRFSDVVQNASGRAIQGASVLILDDTGAPATLYLNRSGALTTNPLTTDSLGRFSFCAADGLYSAQVSVGGVLKATLQDIRLEDPTDGFASLAAPGGAALIGFDPSGTVQSVIDGLSNYTLPVATNSVLGGVKGGGNVAIAGDGTLSYTPYTLPTAAASTLGGIKVGSGLAIDGSSVLSVTYSYSLPTAAAGTLGGVKVGSGLAIDGSGVLSATGGGGTVTSVNTVTPVSGNVTIDTDDVAEGSSLYHTSARVLAVVLAGLSTATNAVITASDTVLSACGKLQKQITDAIATIPAASSSTPAANSGAGSAGSGTTYSRADHVHPASSGGLVFLAAVTPTASATVDFLNVFSSTYDDYLILVDGVTPDADATLYMRVAISGTAQTGADYYNNNIESATAFTAAASQFQVTNNAVLTNGVVTASINVSNVNGTGKGVVGKVAYQNAATPAFRGNGLHGAYTLTGAWTGIRFYWNAGANFQAAGKVRVYGYQKS